MFLYAKLVIFGVLKFPKVR